MNEILPHPKTFAAVIIFGEVEKERKTVKKLFSGCWKT
jgi:hypothetical protein